MAFTPTTIASLRTMTLSPTQEYYVTDEGKEGFWKYIPGATAYPYMDNEGTILINNGGNLVKRIFDSHVNVKWFGAKGDGFTDDTIAIQMALNKLTDGPHSNGTLYFPTGVYLVTGLSIPKSDQNGIKYGKISILGDGMLHTIFKGIPQYVPSDHCDFPDPGLVVTLKNIFSVESPFVNFRNLAIQGTVYEPNKCYKDPVSGLAGIISSIENVYEYTGIKTLTNVTDKSSNHLNIETVSFNGCYIGLNLNGGLGSKLNNCIFGGSENNDFSACYYGLFMEDADGMAPNIITITDSIINFCFKWGIYYKKGSNLTIRGCIISDNGSIIDGVGSVNTGGIFIKEVLNNYSHNTSIVNISETYFINNKGFSFYTNMNIAGIINFFGCCFSGNTNGQQNNLYFGVKIDLIQLPSENLVQIVNLIGCLNNTQINSISNNSFFIMSTDINLIGSTIINSNFSLPINILGALKTNLLV